MVENKYVGVIGVIAMLMGFGGSIVLDQGQLDNAYFCTADSEIGIFERLSSTGKTGYYYDDLGNEKRDVCYLGEWIKLTDYAESQGVDVNTLLKKSPSGVNSPIRYYCPDAGVADECVRLT